MSDAAAPSTIRVNDSDFAYQERGEGEPVVFVHGSVNDFRSWGRQLPVFGERYRAIAYSRRYHWPNAQPRGDERYAVAQHAADLAEFIEALGVAPAHVVGSSYGAMTALTMAMERPELARTLVLGEPPLLPWLMGQPGSAEIVDAFLTSAFRPASLAFARGDAETGIRTFIDGVIGPGAFDRLSPTVRGMMLDNAGPEAIETATPPEAYFPAFAPDDVARLALPVLLVQGETSPQMFGEVTELLARSLPAAERVVIPAASHGMHGQQPEAYNAAVLGFLGRHGGARSGGG